MKACLGRTSKSFDVTIRVKCFFTGARIGFESEEGTKTRKLADIFAYALTLMRRFRSNVSTLKFRLSLGIVTFHAYRVESCWRLRFYANIMAAALNFYVQTQQIATVIIGAIG